MIGLFSFPRRIPDYPVCYMGYSYIMFFGLFLLIGIVCMFSIFNFIFCIMVCFLYLYSVNYLFFFGCFVFYWSVLSYLLLLDILH